ncbi:MAG: pyrroline-5-carboxylate reductase [Microscillaceae bacterium]|nr:pyrroline-5-carboxylate reductase [Microscillaceae bacterium]
MQLNEQNFRVCILGGGNLGRALAEGFLESGQVLPENLRITRRKTHLLADLAQKGLRVMADNPAAAQGTDLVLLAVKPKIAFEVLAEISPVLHPGQILVSVVTGVALTELQEAVPAGVLLFRAMPNTAVSIRESMTCIATQNASPEDCAKVLNLFEAVGKAILIEDELMAASTVLGACGIAFALRYIRAASQGGIEIGFDAQTAQLIAAQVVKGAAGLLLETGHHPEQEIDKVTTPQGCTIVGLNEMEHQGFSSALIKGLKSSHLKIADIARQANA